jgi:hypothetical protein
LRAQTSVHRFGAITSQPNRIISLELLGDAPSAFLKYFDVYPIETSTNLADWTPLTTLMRANLATNALVYLFTVAQASHRLGGARATEPQT